MIFPGYSFLISPSKPKGLLVYLESKFSIRIIRINYIHKKRQYGSHPMNGEISDGGTSDFESYLKNQSHTGTYTVTT